MNETEKEQSREIKVNKTNNYLIHNTKAKHVRLTCTIKRDLI